MVACFALDLSHLLPVRTLEAIGPPARSDRSLATSGLVVDAVLPLVPSLGLVAVFSWQGSARVGKTSVHALPARGKKKRYRQARELTAETKFEMALCARCKIPMRLGQLQSEDAHFYVGWREP